MPSRAGDGPGRQRLTLHQVAPGEAALRIELTLGGDPVFAGDVEVGLSARCVLDPTAAPAVGYESHDVPHYCSLVVMVDGEARGNALGHHPLRRAVTTRGRSL